MKKFLLINYTTPNTSATEIPYLWLTLKSYFQRNSKDPSAWHWLDPIHSSYANDEEVLIQQIVNQSPDVIGISCYMWNDKLTLSIVEEVKRRLPNVKIIAGGPALYYEHNTSWFVSHWYIDAVCEYSGYGEVFITDYLDGVPVKDIPFAVYPNLRRAFWTKSTGTFNRRSFNYPLPYLDNVEYLKRFNYDNVKVILDTSRGCPYSCTFCEWGGGTSTKVVFKSLEDTIKELELVFDILKPSYVDIINANFGISKDDVVITQKIVELNKKYKCVKAVNLYGPSKTNKANLKAIYELLVKEKISDSIKISIQHTDPTILKNIKRIDIPYDEQLEMYGEFCTKYNVALRMETMIGLPGETLDTFYKLTDDMTRSELLEPMMHEWMMLPSAPAANLDYANEMKIKTKKVRYNNDTYDMHMLSRSQYSVKIDLQGERHLLQDHKWLEPYEVVVSTYSYSEEDWAQMELYKYYFSFLNRTGIISPIQDYLRSKNFDMADFNKSLFQFLLTIQTVKNCYDKFITDLKSDEPIDLLYTDLGDRLPYFSHYSVLKFLILVDSKKFFDHMGEWLYSKYKDDMLLKICQHIQENIKSPMKEDKPFKEKMMQCISMCKYWGDNMFMEDTILRSEYHY